MAAPSAMAQLPDRAWSATMMLADSAVTGDVSMLTVEQDRDNADGGILVQSEFGPLVVIFRRKR